MGKKIDHFVLITAAAGAFYIFFYRAFSNGILSVVLALLCCAVLEKILLCIRKRIRQMAWFQKATMRKHAGSSILRLACMPEESAREAADSLIRKAYDENCPLELIQLHPSMCLSQDRLFAAWKAHQGQEKLIVCTSCKTDAACRILASSLRMPKVALVDSEVLSRLISEYPDGMYEQAESSVPVKLRVQHAASLLLNRKNAPRCILFFITMMIMYLLSANPWYLASSLFLLLLAIVSLHRRSRPSKLF